MADVGISRYNVCFCTAYRCMEAGDCHVALRAPRNDISDGAVQQHDKLKFTNLTRNFVCISSCEVQKNVV